MKTLPWVLLAALWAGSAYAQVPDVHRVCEKASEHAELEGPLDSWSARARLKHLVPDIEIDVVTYGHRRSGDIYRETLAPMDGELAQKTLQTTTDTDAQERLGLRVRAKFELGGLIYDNNESRAEVLARDRAAERELLCARVIEFYFQWWEARRALHLPNADPSNLAGPDEARFRAHLDALTNGWFTLQIQRKRP